MISVRRFALSCALPSHVSHLKYKCRGRRGRGGRIIIDRIRVDDLDFKELSKFFRVIGSEHFFPKAIASGFPTIYRAHDARGRPEVNRWVRRRRVVRLGNI